MTVCDTTAGIGNSEVGGAAVVWTDRRDGLNSSSKFFFYFQGVLCQVNQSTKAVLNLLGVFTVSSFHAYICARSPSLLSNLLAGRGASRKRSLPTNQNLEQNSSVDRQNSLGMSVSKSFEDDEDDFNESSLIHTRIPGKKVSNPNIVYRTHTSISLD